jgi:hypothetical protein
LLFVEVVDHFIVVIVLLVDLASRRGASG